MEKANFPRLAKNTSCLVDTNTPRYFYKYLTDDSERPIFSNFAVFLKFAPLLGGTNISSGAVLVFIAVLYQFTIQNF